MSSPVHPHQRTGIEGAQVELIRVELGFQFRVRGEQNLEPTVEEETIDDVGADAPSDSVRGLEDHHFMSEFAEKAGGG